MTPAVDAATRWREVDRLFAEALELPADGRRAFLDAACAGDAGLRAAVEELLAADERLGTFLETPAGEALGHPAPWSGEEGGRVGPYRLLRPIGSGGMGTVYLARRDDEHYERLVAVKVLRSGLESTEARRRFLDERQILARLEHPNVARLYDGGATGDGRPFLVMELIEGLPLDRYCDLHRLPVPARLDLFRKVCAAVQHAHQHLLVHRDLKPGNILVTPEGEPKLLDFGIAERLGDPETSGRPRAMTPLYASPEQVEGGPVTTASDVYSLGVLLCELLAGHVPYRPAADGPRDLEAAIVRDEPERPSAVCLREGDGPGPEAVAAARSTRPAALARRLRGDLDAVVAKALAKDPERRYSSVALLSRDVENHLALLPVAARPDAPLYRAGRFARRHLTAVVAAVLVALLGAGLLATFFIQGRRVARERDKARYALSFLIDTFKQADPYHTRGERLTAREILDHGARRVTRELAGQPDVQAALMDSMGEVATGLGRYDQAAPLLARALALRRQAFGPGSLEVAETLEHRALLERELSDLSHAEADLRRSLALRRRLLGGGDLAVARTLDQLAEVLMDELRYAESERLRREALAIAREAEGPAGPTVAASLIGLAKTKKEAGDAAVAERLLRQGLAVEAKALGADDPRLYRDQTWLAEILIDAGRYAEAEALLRRCLAAQRRILGVDHPDEVSTLNDLGVAVQRLGRFKEAEAIDREVLRISRQAFGPTHWRVGSVLGNLAATLVAQDEPEKTRAAIPYLEEAVAIRRKNFGDGDPMVAQGLLLLAEAHRQLQEPELALPLARQALAIVERAEGPEHPHAAYPLVEIGFDLMRLHRDAEAEPYLRRSLAVRLRELAPGHPSVAKSKMLLGECLTGLGRYAEAEAMLREADAAFSAQFPADDYRVQLTRTLRRQLEEARASARRAGR